MTTTETAAPAPADGAVEQRAGAGSRLPAPADRPDEPAADAHDIEDVVHHMRHIRRLRDELAEVDLMATRELQRIEEWQQERHRTLKAQIEWHSRPIESWHRMVLDADPSRKTINTPHGRSKIVTPRKPRVKVDDDAAVIEWATVTAPVAVTRRVSISDLRRVLDTADFALDGEKVIDTRTGEVVPGVHAETPPSTWTVDTDPGEPL